MVLVYEIKQRYTTLNLFSDWFHPDLNTNMLWLITLGEDEVQHGFVCIFNKHIHRVFCVITYIQC